MSFFVVLERQPKIGSYRLPTHRRSAHRNFLFISSYLPFLFYGNTLTIVTDMQQRVNRSNKLGFRYFGQINSLRLKSSYICQYIEPTANEIIFEIFVKKNFSIDIM